MAIDSKRRISRSELREMLVQGGAERLLERLAMIEELLFTGHEVRVNPVTRQPELPVPLDGARISGLKAAADLIWRRIDKVVPTPRAIELTGEEGTAINLATPDKLVLATKLLALVRERENAESAPEPAGDVIDGEATELPPWLQ